LKNLDILAFDAFEYLEIKEFPTFEFESIDVLDSEPEIYDSNLESLADFILENTQKTIYLSLNIHVSKILLLEKLLKEREINVSRNEKGNNGVVINSSKTIEKYIEQKSKKGLQGSLLQIIVALSLIVSLIALLKK
jgi:hypothetical protein